MQKIAKVIAHAGICSRRQAEQLVLEGRVHINGEVVTEPAVRVSDSDDIKVDGKSISTEKEPQMWLYHKPKGVIVTHNDPQGRTTVFELVDVGQRVISVGRLDYNTEGLLILTNSGDIVRYMELPSTQLKRVYRARVFGRINDHILKTLEKGCVIDGMRYQPFKVHALTMDKANNWLEIEITEGKNREIHRVMEHVNLDVTRLIRIQYGPYFLGTLAPGDIKKAPLIKIPEKNL